MPLSHLTSLGTHTLSSGLIARPQQTAVPAGHEIQPEVATLFKAEQLLGPK
jgi:hypothetical protein